MPRSHGRRCIDSWLAFFLVCSLCVVADIKSVKAEEEIKVGAAASLLYLPFYVAIEQGFFAKHGLKVDLITTNTPEPALISGDIDFMLKSGEAAVLAAARSKPIPAVAMIQQRNSLSFDVPISQASPDGISFPQNLQRFKGRISTIGIAVRGSSSEVFVRHVMDAAGLKEDRDYTMVVLGSGSSIIAALKANRIDAAVLWPPFSQQAYLLNVAAPLVRQWRNEGPDMLKRAAGIAVMVNSAVLEKRPEVVRKTVAAVVEAGTFVRDFATNKAKLVEIAAKYTGVSDQALLEAAAESVAALAHPAVTCDAFLEAAKIVVASGSIKSAPLCEHMVAVNFAPKP